MNFNISFNVIQNIQGWEDVEEYILSLKQKQMYVNHILPTVTHTLIFLM